MKRYIQSSLSRKALFDPASTAYRARYTDDVNYLRELASRKTDVLREAVAKNSNCPVDILVQFLYDKNRYVRDSAFYQFEKLSDSERYRLYTAYPDNKRVAWVVFHMGSGSPQIAHEIAAKYGWNTYYSADVGEYSSSHPRFNMFI